ncbi:MAG TPA: DUF4097 family beta strand repeat-containing protein [Solimonas sp.]|nr:DUF4097 family beta strand repeat-containing protein [Solimonas sp.]
MSIRKIMAALALAAMSAAALAEDGSPIDERRPLNAEGKVYVNNMSGTIQVQSWDRNEVHVTGELGYGAEKLDIGGDASALRIEVRLPKHSRNVEETSLLVRVPVGARLELEGVSSDIAVQGVRGAVQASSVSGDVHLSVASSEVTAQSVSGDVTLRAPSRNTKLNSVSGDVHATGLRDRITIETVSGSVQLDAQSVSDLDVKSVSGDFNLDLALDAAPKVTAETLSGEIELALTAEPNALVTMKTFSGELQTEFGKPVPEDKHRWEQSFGAGKGRIDLNSFSGDIRLSNRGR